MRVNTRHISTEPLIVAEVIESILSPEIALTNRKWLVIHSIYVDKHANPRTIASWAWITAICRQPVWILETELAHQEEIALKLKYNLLRTQHETMPELNAFI